MSPAELGTFLLVSAVFIGTPGQDTALTVRNTLLGGRSGGLWTAAGVAAGQAGWALAAASGIAGLLAASEPAFLAIKIIGVGYLLYLGAQALVSAWRNREPIIAAGSSPRRGGGRALRQGMLSNLANPKMAAFFVSFLPQFAGGANASFATMLALGLVFCALTFGWLALYGLAVTRARHVLGRPLVRRWLDALAGCAFVYLGLRLATQGR